MNDDQNAGFDSGRRGLSDWQDAEPTNFFTSDQNLQRTLEFYEGANAYRENVAKLYRFGGVSATTLDVLARRSNERENLPRLQRFDAIGNRVESVEYHPSYHEAGALVYGAGAMSAHKEPSNNVLALALFYLSAQNGEAGHNCPLACTAGVIKSLQQVGLGDAHAERAEHYLERLLDEDYATNFTGAQFVTEVQGGSDVGSNATVATQHEDGSWRLNGQKWFCSNVSADIALVTAQIPDQGESTRGLGLFLVPKLLDDGTANGMYIQRLKEK